VERAGALHHLAQSTSLDTLTKGVAQLASGQLGSGNRYPLKLARRADDDPGRSSVLHLPAADHERLRRRREGIGASHGGNHLRQREQDYGDGFRAVSDLNLDVKDGEFVVFVGRPAAARRLRCA
jgi:hypothetical protein